MVKQTSSLAQPLVVAEMEGAVDKRIDDVMINSIIDNSYSSWKYCPEGLFTPAVDYTQNSNRRNIIVNNIEDRIIGSMQFSNAAFSKRRSWMKRIPRRHYIKARNSFVNRSYNIECGNGVLKFFNDVVADGFNVSFSKRRDDYCISHAKVFFPNPQKHPPWYKPFRSMRNPVLLGLRHLTPRLSFLTYRVVAVYLFLATYNFSNFQTVVYQILSTVSIG